MRKPGRKLRISLIGAGSVGTALAVALHRAGHSIVSVISRSRSSARRCAKLVSCRNFSTESSSLAQTSDLILIALPEETIKETVQQLWRLDLDFHGTRVAHTSGVLPDDVLRLLKTRGAKTFALHPIQTFPQNLSVGHHVRSLAGISYGFDGDRASLVFARRLVADLGGSLFRVPKEAKILYHLACVFASNYSVAILGAVEMLVQGFSGRGSLKHFKGLMNTSVANAFSVGSSKALTGPIIRGSTQTVRTHLAELKKKHKDLLPLYRSLGMLALSLASKQKRLQKKQFNQMKKMLQPRSSLSIDLLSLKKK